MIVIMYLWIHLAVASDVWTLTRDTWEMTGISLDVDGRIVALLDMVQPQCMVADQPIQPIKGTLRWDWTTFGRLVPSYQMRMSETKWAVAVSLRPKNLPTYPGVVSNGDLTKWEVMSGEVIPGDNGVYAGVLRATILQLCTFSQLDSDKLLAYLSTASTTVRVALADLLGEWVIMHYETTTQNEAMAEWRIHDCEESGSKCSALVGLVVWKK